MRQKTRTEEKPLNKIEGSTKPPPSFIIDYDMAVDDDAKYQDA